MNIMAGKVLQNGKYILDAPIGQGGFGITYKATHSYLGQTVVIKTLHENLRQHENFERFQEQFVAEAQRLAKCQHPNIVRVLDFFEEAGQSFIVMDYIPGPTLADLLKQGQPLPEAQAINYICQIGSALSVVHQNGLLHRDVKPQNIIRREGTETVILIDFGIAREFTPGVTQTHTGILSAGYAPIEQYLPRGRRSPATDIYALAATLYTLLVGQPPVPAALRDRVPLPKPRQLQPNLSQQVEQAIMHGLEMEAERRPQTVEAWLNLLPKSRFQLSQPTVSLSAVTEPPTGEEAEQQNGQIPHPKKFDLKGLRVFAITAAIGAIVGIGFGLTLRFGNSGKPILQEEQSFPPTNNWPTSVPTAPPPSTPEPNSQQESSSNSQSNSRSNSRSSIPTVEQKATTPPRRYKPKLRVRSPQAVNSKASPQPTPTPPSTAAPAPSPAAVAPASPAVLPAAQAPAQPAVATPNPTPVENPTGVSTLEVAPSPAATPAATVANPEPAPAKEPSDPPPAVVQPLPPIPASEGAAPSTESTQEP
ncbi:serine/threonine protein kinase [Planktothrix sp. FACHB-1355]|uniref:Serine/threonine protein kinase n=2 Tax=Cyanophyceae TaxID=3028117 RepID=A0A926VJL4_9CYAN|nr:serine/threonine protein kinase [Aerosakkonema funiforme FACHB-1375]MBD3559171.1 serine/threonine protein kinase [Planktothrix sp. FACHB-1355]